MWLQASFGRPVIPIVVLQSPLQLLADSFHEAGPTVYPSLPAIPTAAATAPTVCPSSSSHWDFPIDDVVLRTPRYHFRAYSKIRS